VFRLSQGSVVTLIRWGRWNSHHHMRRKGQIPLRYLVADRSEAGRRPAASRNLADHLERAAGLRPASNLSGTR